MKKIDLNGTWLYKIGSTGTANNLPPDNIDWHEMQIPSNWHINGLKDHAGVVWYKKTFLIENVLEKEKCWLCFGGVDYFTNVWINGAFAGSHEGYFQAFQFNISEFIKKGENSILVKVDSPFEDPEGTWPNRKRLIKGVLNHHDCRPGAWHPTFGQSGNTGGIWGQVNLLFTDCVKINQIRVDTKTINDESAEININVEMLNHCESSLDARIEITAEYGGLVQVQDCYKVKLRQTESKLTYRMLIDEPRLWSTWDHGDPNLYKLKVRIEWQDGFCESETLFGIRTIHSDAKGQIFLNGKPIFIRGTNMIPAQWFIGYQEKEIQEDISLLLKANINAVRIHAHVTRPEFYSACDKAGLLIWQDFPLQWGYAMAEEFIESAKRQICEMVEGLYNHPSIYCWCCHNEPPSDSGFLDEVLQEEVIQTDSSRIIQKNSTFREHPYFGWYEGCLEQFIALPGGPIPSEFGAQALPDLESLRATIPEKALWPPDWNIWAYHDFQYDQTFHVVHLAMGENIESFIENSQKYQYRYIKYVIEMYRRGKNNSIFGIYQFMFVDCWPAITWSVVDYFRKPKRGYEALKIAYQPVLISFDIRRYEVINGMNIFAGVHVVNDLDENYDGTCIEINVFDKKGQKLLGEKIHTDISPNSACCLITTDYLTTQWRIPSDAELGKIKIEGKIFSREGQLLSQNHEELEIVETLAKEYVH